MEKIRSSIHPSVMRDALFRGTAIAGIGGAFLLAGGTFLPPQRLQEWGFPLFFLAIVLIAWGLLPYCLLRRLETNPYMLVVEGEEWIHFFAKGKIVLSIPCKSIESIEWTQQQSTHFWLFGYREIYGIKMKLKTPLPEKVVVKDRHFDYEKFRQNSQKKQQCDLFFPWFSKQSFKQLEVVTICL